MEINPMTKKALVIVFLIGSICGFLSTPVDSATTGKLAGEVIDASTGEPLPMVNVFIVGTTMGAAADMSGQYVILNVPPGVYTLKATMLGYQTMTYENVRVSIDLTTRINFNLSSEVLAGQEVTVVAERPMVTRDLTATTAVVGAEEISALPVTEVNEAIELQAGLVKDAGGGFHIRGGRSGEVSFWIDGVPVTDVYDGNAVVNVNKDMVQELQVVSGAFNAEYGQAMSGIVNIATKSGDNDFGGSFTTYFGDHLSNHTNPFINIDHVDPISIRNFDGSVHGALVKDKLFYYLNSRYIHFDGWIYGQRKYNPSTVAIEVTDRIPGSFLEEIAPEYLKDAKLVDVINGEEYYNFLYLMGTNRIIDSLITGVENIDSLREANYKNPKGDGKYVPMNWNRKIYSQAKLIYKPIPSLTLSLNTIYDDVDYQEWGLDNERDYKYNPEGAPKKFSTGLTNILKMTHLLSSRTFYEIGLSYFTKDFSRYVYEDSLVSATDLKYVHPNAGLQQPFSYKTGGTDNKRFFRQTNTLLGKFDITSQVTNTHQMKVGIEFRRHDVTFRDITLQPIQAQSSYDPIFDSPYITTNIQDNSSIYASWYNHKPLELSAYIQDKMEFKNMIVNFGLRFDYFEPDGKILTDDADPSIYNPIKPQNLYYDYGTDGLPNTFDPDGTEDNGLRDPGEPEVTYEDRLAYWYKDADAKYKVSPRIGVSFPITDRGVIHFSYGHFFQVPRFERLYQNPDFELGSGTGNQGVIGNANLKPEQTISGEIGLQQQVTDDITMDITGYFRDVRDLAGTRAQEILVYGGFAKYSKLVNSDFGFIRGIIFALNKRFTGGLSASIDYTLQQAKGTNSDPEAARNALAGGSQPEVQLTALDWDQRHTINATLSYSANSWGGSLIAQYGSGLPYTPRADRDISTLLTNNQRKPAYFNVDLKAFRDFDTPVGKFTVFTRVFNLLDRLNEVNVFNDSGQAGFTADQQTAANTNPPELINSLDDWFTRPTHYAEPRRVEVGFTYLF